MAIKNIVVEGDVATCGHPITGSPDVKLEGKGASRVQMDTGGNLIIGPGATTLYINNQRASLPLDAILTHGKPPHAVPFTTSTQQTSVWAGDGFVGGAGSNNNIAGGAAGDQDGNPFNNPRYDLKLTSFYCLTPSPNVSNTTANCYETRTCGQTIDGATIKNVLSRLRPSCFGPLKFGFTISNSGDTDTPPFRCRVWEVPSPNAHYVFNENSQGSLTGIWSNQYHPNDIQPYSNGSHIFTVDSVPAGGSISGVAEVPVFRSQKAGGYQPGCGGGGTNYPNEPRYYFMSVDVFNDVGEVTEEQVVAGARSITVDAV